MRVLNIILNFLVPSEVCLGTAVGCELPEGRAVCPLSLGLPEGRAVSSLRFRAAYDPLTSGEDFQRGGDLEKKLYTLFSEK